MNFSDSANNFNAITYTGFLTQLDNIIPGTINIIVSEADWMPYKFFEYDPLWHKKYAAIKIQMDTMWD